jgi:hypothetical protein
MIEEAFQEKIVPEKPNSSSINDRASTKIEEENAVTTEDIKRLDTLLDNENSHLKQWPKHTIAFVLSLFCIFCNFLRGGKGFDSFVGITKCSVMDWTIMGVFITVMATLSYIGVRINRSEQALKKKVGRGRHTTDLAFEGKQLFYLCFFAFVGGWVSGALGLGGGSIFNPLMISMGVPPQVSTATGMYMIMCSTAVTSIMYIAYGAMDFQFGVWLSIWSSMGILSGITLVNKLMKKYKRQSILVFILVAVLMMSALLVPIQTGIDTVEYMQKGIDIWKMNSICD